MVTFKGDLQTKGLWYWVFILVPLVIGVRGVVVEVDLFPHNCFGVLGGHWIVHSCPHIVPINVTSKVFFPLFAMVMVFVGEFDQSIIYELM